MLVRLNEPVVLIVGGRLFDTHVYLKLEPDAFLVTWRDGTRDFEAVIRPEGEGTAWCCGKIGSPEAEALQVAYALRLQ